VPIMLAWIFAALLISARVKVRDSSPAPAKARPPFA
jgi:hypothetical protein